MGRKQKEGQQQGGGAAAGGQAAGKQKQQPQQKQPQQQQQQARQGGIVHYQSFLQVLALDIGHTSPSVLLFFDKERYLFNAGEGIQRLFREHKLKINRVNAYLVTRVSTETLGGLPGMALSVTPPDAGGLLDRQAGCIVKGPPGLSTYVDAFRMYINQENTVQADEFDHGVTEPVVKTDVVSITPILVRVAAHASAAASNGRRQEGEGEAASPVAKRQRTTGQDVSGDAAAGADGAVTVSAQAVAEGGAGGSGSGSEDDEGRRRPAGLLPPDVAVYVARLAGRPGKFMPDKARAAGVPPGPLFGELQRGHSVTTPAGREVHPHEVCEPPVPGPLMMLMDYGDSAATLDAVAADERVLRAAAEAEAASSSPSSGAASPPAPSAPPPAAASGMCVAVHLVGRELAASAAFAAWQQRLGPAWSHLVVSPGEHQPSTIPRASMFQAKLHCLQPHAFPLMALANSEDVPRPPEPTEEMLAAEAEAVAAAAAEAAAKKGGGKKGGGGGGGGGGGAKQGSGGGGAANAGSVGGAGGAGDGAQGAAGGAAAPAGSAAAPAGAAGGGAAALVVRQQPPVFPFPAGSCQPAMSAVRVNLMPPARRGLEYGEVFQYDSSSKVMQDMSENPEFAKIVAAARSLAAGGPADGAAPASAAGAAAEAGEAMAVDGGADAEGEAAEQRRGSGAQAAAREAEQQAVPEVLAGGNRRLAELTFLGTASSQPSKFRNVSGCYLDLFDAGGLLVDCGEDSMGQLQRRYGRAEADRRLLSLGLVWVSHMHADHHGGLYRLLEWRARRGAPPLLVVGPRRLFDALVKYSAVVPLQFSFVPNQGLVHGWDRPARVQAALDAALAGLRLRAFAPFPVDHVRDSHGLRVEGEGGWKVVWSADTRPCQQTIDAARNATLLVHEATFEKEMQEEARAKKHSTAHEAVEVGEKAGAYRTLLTHFSTRYPTLPEELRSAYHPSVAVAMDLMSVNLADLPGLPRLLGPLGELFSLLDLEKEDAEDA